ncbi:hypothetical protein LR48_Vigan08g024600 [Vigna angularis]|uniref:Uncharacterized protein n=2 Tax=Phaseolus angularis TaxID=3914 RepID=A0A0L9V3Y5_PHAAN|nr:hypothetical protein LR48_Vigan08g024600 [Vigna angularis]BAT89476.1 hypothetical protein VIGAN_06043900 [Vigna angularis var. angularis]
MLSKPVAWERRRLTLRRIEGSSQLPITFLLQQQDPQASSSISIQLITVQPPPKIGSIMGEQLTFKGKVSMEWKSLKRKMEKGAHGCKPFP